MPAGTGAQYDPATNTMAFPSPAKSYGLTAFHRAIGQLVAAVEAGIAAHPCDVRFGREVVAVLAAADEACRSGRTVSI